MEFKKIKTFPHVGYRVDVLWNYLEESLERFVNDNKLDLNPNFQRDYVWTEEQKIKYVEFILKNGLGAKEIYFNHPGWMHSFEGEFVLVDGKQRLEAVRNFLNNDIKIFNKYYYGDFSDRLPIHASFSVNIASLKTRKEVLQWYIDMNSGGTVHTAKDLDKVKELLRKEK